MVRSRKILVPTSKQQQQHEQLEQEAENEKKLLPGHHNFVLISAWFPKTTKVTRNTPKNYEDGIPLRLKKNGAFIKKKKEHSVFRIMQEGVLRRKVATVSLHTIYFSRQKLKIL
mgnify:CR=1 FL=1